MKSKRNLIFLLLGPVLFFLCYLFLPESFFTSAAARGAIGTVAWMALWWVTGPVDYAVTAFLPIAVNAVFSFVNMSEVIANYASETILLLLGASIINVSWELTGLDKRIAAKCLSMVGGKLSTQIIFWFLLSAGLSSILPNAVVCATITPIAVSMLKFIGEKDISESKNGSLILLTIAYAAGVGGLATPLGGAMNLVTVDYIEQLTGEEYMYTSWVIRFLPFMLVLVVSNIAFLLIRHCKKDSRLAGSKEYFSRIYKEMKPMSKEEKIALFLFTFATVMAFSRELYADILPGLKPAYVFVICAILSFLVKTQDGERLMKWKKVQGKIIWDLIYIFAGGMALGTLINKSGAAQDIGNAVSAADFGEGFLLVFIIVTFTILLSDVTSNTATAAVAIPIVISIVNGMGKNPIPYVYIASIGVNLSYMLPTSIRAIPVGYGLKPKFMFKEGVMITVIVIALMSVIAYLLLNHWPAFSTV
ncbi:MAG: Di-and tricarboxylate transporter [Ruminococcaceae bacterium]|nr:Di-and tricarboxylate transporter [Oscillospiraceae bacterium]